MLATCSLLLSQHSDILWFHIAEVGLLPFTHEVKVKWAVAEGAGSRGWNVEWETDLLPHLHQFTCEQNGVN